MAVLAIIFRFWNAQGRPLTITTTDKKGDERRGGRLLSFANDIVRELTDPPTGIKGETFHVALKNYKEHLEITRLVEGRVGKS